MTPDRPISELFARQRPLRSLEFFPPKDDAGVESLRATAAALKRMNPDFVSVTYGAGGTTRDRTAQVSTLLKKDFQYTVMPHLTCVGHSRTELGEIADRIHAGGFRNIMTLRGDPPKGASEFTVAADGLRNASELVRKMEANVHLLANPSEACPANWQPGAKTLTPGKDIVGNVASVLAK